MPERPANPLKVFRAAAGLLLVAVAFLASDLFLRLVVATRIRLHPASREASLTRFAQSMARGALGLVRLSGARIGPIPQIPAEPGVLVLMNHQSLFDIPIAYRSLRPGDPRVVTRERYARGIPLVSIMLRMYEHPLVRPGDGSPELLARLREVARTTPHPLCIFPEGGRTRDGRIRRFQRGGLRTILAQRRWRVYLLVADGMWRCARLEDFVRYAGTVEVQLRSLGPFEAPAPGEDPEAFIDDMHERMCRQLNEMRTQGRPATIG